MPPAPLSPAEREGLLEIIRRRRLIWVCAAAFPPVAVLAELTLPGSGSVFAAVGFTVYGFAIIRHGLARCPRCSERFNWLNPWTGQCTSCGLRLSEARTKRHDEERGIRGGMM